MHPFLVLSLGLTIFGLLVACSDTSDPNEWVAPLVQRIAELEERAAEYEFRIAEYEETIAEYENQLAALKRPQTNGDELVAPDTVSRFDSADEGVEVRLTPGVLAGEHWIGRVTGSGFPPGATVYSVGCLGSYVSFNAELCDYENPTVMIADANGDITSGIISVPTDPDGGCALVGTTGPDGASGSGDEIGALVCYEPHVSAAIRPRARMASG